MVDDAPTPPEPAPDEVVSLPKAVSALFADLPGLLTDRVHLLSLELRRASNALGQMVALGLLAAILVATAWLALWVGLAAAFLAVGLAWPGARRPGGCDGHLHADVGEQAGQQRGVQPHWFRR